MSTWIMRPLLTQSLAVAIAVALFLVPNSASASDSTLFARGSYWSGFVEFWSSRIVRQEGVVLVAIGVGIVSLFIITRSKWRK